MRIPYYPPSASGQFTAKNRGSAWSQSRARSAQRSIQPNFLNALDLRRQDFPGASDSSSNGATSPPSIITRAFFVTLIR